METWVPIMISAAAVIITLIGVVYGRRRDASGDAATSASAMTRLDTKLDSIQSGVEDIRVDLRAQAARMQDFGERLSAVESSCKSAHHRLDQINNRDLNDGR